MLINDRLARKEERTQSEMPIVVRLSKCAIQWSCTESSTAQMIIIVTNMSSEEDITSPKIRNPSKRRKITVVLRLKAVAIPTGKKRTLEKLKGSEAAPKNAAQKISHLKFPRSA